MQHVPENPEEEFNFYMKFAKSLVLNLADPIEKSRAAAWLKKLKSVTDEESAGLKNDYLKLLLFVLQRKRLIGPFEFMPDYDAPLEPFPDKAGLLDVAKKLVALEAHIEEVACGEPNPYMVAVSSDLKEYAVAQEFNKFGAHCYYAVSGDPITAWTNADRGQFPRGARSHEDSVFDTSAASKSKCALQYEQVEQTCVEMCPDASASMSASQRKAGAVADCKGQKSAADSYRWLDRTQDQERTTIDWDPLEGRVEIDKHLETMNRALEELQNDSFMKRGRDNKGRGAAPMAPNASVGFDRDVDDVFGSKFYGAVASVKKICSTEKTCSDGYKTTSQNITQGHSVVSRDALDGGVSQIHKNMNISDARRQGSRQAQRVSRSPRSPGREDASDRAGRGSRRCPARAGGETPSRHEKTTHEHFEPGPDETIDITTTEDDCNERVSFHRLAPGVDESIEITKTNQPRQRYDPNQTAGQTPRRPCPALRKIPAPPSRIPQRSADSCPAPCGSRARNMDSSRIPVRSAAVAEQCPAPCGSRGGNQGPSRGSQLGTRTSLTQTSVTRMVTRPKHR